MAWDHLLAHETFELFEKMLPFITYLNVHGRNEEVTTLLQNAIECIQGKMENQPKLKRLYVDMLLDITFIKHTHYHSDEAMKRSENAIALLEPLGYSDEFMLALVFPCHYCFWHPQNFERLQSNLQKALDLSQANDDVLWQAHILYHMAYNYYRHGEQEVAWQCLQTAENFVANLPSQTLPNNQRQIIFEHITSIYLDKKMYAQAEKWIDEQLFLTERVEWVYGISIARGYKVQIALAQHNIAEAKKQTAAIIHWHQTHARDWQMLGALWDRYANNLLMEIGEDERAVEILSFVYHHPVAVKPSLDGSKECLDKLYERMDVEIFNVAYERGKQMKLRQVVADAMAFLTSSTESSNHSAQTVIEIPIPDQIIEANAQLIEPLTERELEVLAQIAQGHTNREIAEQLFVGLSTVKKHITHIYGKLAVESRTQALLRAQELNLI